MADLSAAVRQALGRYWPEVYGGAAAKLTTAQLFTGIRDRATALGLPSPGVSATAISTLRGYAGRMLGAAGRLASADQGAPLDASYIAEAPWSRGSAAQATMPIYNIGFNHTIQRSDGSTVERWQTITLTGTLPPTVGELNGLVRSEAQLLAQEGSETSTTTPRGTSLDVASISITVV